MNRTDGRYHEYRTVSMYVYKGGAVRVVMFTWMQATDRERTQVGRERASASERHTDFISGHQDRKRGNGNDQRRNHPVSERQRAVRVV